MLEKNEDEGTTLEEDSYSWKSTSKTRRKIQICYSKIHRKSHSFKYPYVRKEPMDQFATWTVEEAVEVALRWPIMPSI